MSPWLTVAMAGILSGLPSMEPSSFADLQALCEDLRPAGWMAFEGEAATTSREAHEQRRARRLSETLSIELPWERFAAAWEEGERGASTLLLRKSFTAFDGGVVLFALDRDQLVFECGSPEDAARQGEAVRSGALTLSLVFRPSNADVLPCAVSASGKIALSIEVLDASLRVDGAPTARLAGEAKAPVGAGAPAEQMPPDESASTAQGAEAVPPARVAPAGI